MRFVGDNFPLIYYKFHDQANYIAAKLLDMTVLYLSIGLFMSIITNKILRRSSKNTILKKIQWEDW